MIRMSRAGRQVGVWSFAICVEPFLRAFTAFGVGFVRAYRRWMRRHLDAVAAECMKGLDQELVRARALSARMAKHVSDLEDFGWADHLEERAAERFRA